MWELFFIVVSEGSQSQKDYVELVAERPIIKKMQDNMVVGSDAKLTNKSIQHVDFPEFHPKRPIIAKLIDNLKIEGIKWVQCCRLLLIHLNVKSILGSLVRADEIVCFDYWKMGKGEADLTTAYNKSYVQQQSTERPEIKRMHSNLAVGGGHFGGVESVGRVDYPQHDVTRPIIMKPVNNLSVYDGSYPHSEMTRRSWSTPVNDVILPAMNRAKQMQSSIYFGSDSDFPGWFSIFHFSVFIIIF